MLLLWVKYEGANLTITIGELRLIGSMGPNVAVETKRGASFGGWAPSVVLHHAEECTHDRTWLCAR